MSNIVLASANPHKLLEINAIAKKYDICFDLVDGDFNPDETGVTFEENSYIKAYEAAKITGKIAFADDTGLCVDKLNGAPGIYSARYAPTPKEKIDKILCELTDVPQNERTAHFICSIVAVNPQGELLHKTEGIIKGLITLEPKGSQGFGYDPIFFIPEPNKTMAELTDDEKNTISHRALALIPMIEFFKGLY